MIHLAGHTSAVHALAFSPDSALLASGSKGGGVRLWDAFGELARIVVVEGGTTRHAVAFSPSGTRLVFTEGRRLARTEVAQQTWLIEEASWRSGEMTALAYLTEELLAVGFGRRGGAETGPLLLWDVKQGKKRAEQLSGAGGVRAVAVHPPSKLIVWATGDHRLRAWRITSASVKDIPLGKSSPAVAVSPDGETIAAAVDWGVRLFAPDGRHKRAEALTGHKGMVSAVAFSADGRTLASAGWDETVRLWDVESGTLRAAFPLAAGKLSSLAYSPDGTRLAAGSLDGPIVVLDAE